MAILPIGFFAPLPLAIMIPFMAAQSFAMGHAFGTSFQYGKRKISSLTNEEFNALNVTDLHDTLQADIRAMIPSMNESFHRMESFQIEIITSMLNTIIKAGDAFFKFVTSTGAKAQDQGTGQNFLDAFLKDINPLPEAFADDSTFTPTIELSTTQDITNLNPIEKFAFKWMNPNTGIANYQSMSQKEGLYILKQMSAGTLKRFSQFRSGLLRHVDSLNPKKLTAAEQSALTEAAINKSSTGLVHQIATMYNELNRALQALLNPKFKAGQDKAIRLNQLKSQFFAMVKAFNQLVIINKKPGLRINTLKSIQQKRLVPK